MDDNRLVIHNVTLVDATTLHEHAWLASDAGVITATGLGESWRDHALGARVIDGNAGHLTPGFADIHVHGGGGRSHTGLPADTLTVLDAHHRHGTARAVASFVAAPLDVLCAQLRSVASLSRETPRLSEVT